MQSHALSPATALVAHKDAAGAGLRRRCGASAAASMLPGSGSDTGGSAAVRCSSQQSAGGRRPRSALRWPAPASEGQHSCSSAPRGVRLSGAWPRGVDLGSHGVGKRAEEGQP